MAKILEVPGRDSTGLFVRLKALIRSCGDANKHDIVGVLIHACLDEGINTRSQIIGVIKHLGYNSRHVAIVLEKGAGPNPERYFWYCDACGRYTPWA